MGAMGTGVMAAGSATGWGLGLKNCGILSGAGACGATNAGAYCCT
jgi:hypothetical protein